MFFLSIKSNSILAYSLLHTKVYLAGCICACAKQYIYSYKKNGSQLLKGIVLRDVFKHLKILALQESKM